MITLSEAVSLRIRELLKENKMTQYKLSMRSGVPQTTISALVRNLHERPYITVIYDVAQGFNMTLSEFFNYALFNDVE